ncbi:MAG: DMP19 family protein [Ruminococcus sp.]|nr:DMP19 family protein [Ruminococcus sp.]
MIWVDGSEIDPKQFSGEELCGKLALEMWADCEHWSKCAEFIQNALFIIDFDTVTNMEGFPTPYYGYFTSEYYSQIIKAFHAIGDNKDADILTEAGRLDSYYQKILDSTEDENESDKIYDEFSEKIDELEKKLYLNTEFDMWALLYKYIDEHIGKL